MFLKYSFLFRKILQNILIRSHTKTIPFRLKSLNQKSFNPNYHVLPFLFILLIFQVHYNRILKINITSQIIYFQTIHQLGFDCLKNSGSPYQPPTAKYLPFDYKSIQTRNNITNFLKHLQYKYTVTTHCFSYHCGPWLEKYLENSLF